MITVIARSRFRAETLDEVLKIYRNLVAQTRQEPGCHRYELFQEDGHPGHLTMVEEWADREALRAHLTDPKFLALAGSLRPLAESASEITVHQLVL